MHEVFGRSAIMKPYPGMGKDDISLKSNFKIGIGHAPIGRKIAARI
jgi:hypothetical protein